MRHRALALLLLAALPFADEALAQSCAGKPDGNQMHVRGPACDANSPCFPNQAQTFTVEKNTTCYPWYIPCPGYSIQSCDIIDWRFGDGTTATVVGQPYVTHAYKAPGLYSIEGTVSNPNGSGYIHTALIVAVQPLATVAFVDPLYTVSETAGSVTAKLRRSGDTTRRVTIDYRTGYALGTVENNLTIVEGKVVFEAGETLKTITIPVVNDNVYNGDSYHNLWIECYTGEALLPPQTFMGSTQIKIVEDDRPATASAPRSVRVAEGDGGSTLLKIPITLTAPFSEAVHFWWSLYNGTAKYESDFMPPDSSIMSGEAVVPANSTSGEFAVRIIGDTTWEPDEDFTMTWVRSGGPALVIDGSPITITIVNDDPGFPENLFSMPAGEKRSLTLMMGGAAGTKAAVTAADPAIVKVPASITLSGGATTSFDVEALKPGTTAIRATIEGTSKTALTHASVYQPLVLSFDPRALDVREQAAATVALRADPLPAQQLRVVFTNSAPSIAEVPASTVLSSGGKVNVELKGRAPGKAAVTAFLPDYPGQPVASLSLNVVEAASPSVTSIAPATGTPGGGTRAVIAGENFRSDCTVKFGELFATIVSAAPQSLVVTTPPHPAGYVDVSVQCGGRTTTVTNGFQYAATKARAVRK